MTVCARSWGSLAKGWAFCVLPKGHALGCQDWQGRAPDAPWWEDQPDAVAFNEKQVAEERKKLGIDL